MLKNLRYNCRMENHDFFVSNEFHECVLRGSWGSVENMIFKNCCTEEELKGYKIGVNCMGHSALYTAARNFKYDNWAVLKSYGFRYASGEEGEMEILDTDEKFVRAYFKFRNPADGLHVHRMIAKAERRECGMDSSVYDERVIKIFKQLNEEDITKYILRCLQHDWKLKIHFYSNEGYADEVPNNTLLRHAWGYTDIKLHQIHAVIKEKEGFDFSDVVSNLAHELTHMVLGYIFENNGLPYSKGNDEVKMKYEDVMAEVLSEENLSTCDEIIKRVAHDKPRRRHYELIVRVTEMISKYQCDNVENGHSRLMRQAPTLLEFFNEHVLPQLKTCALQNKSRYVRESSSSFYVEDLKVNRNDAETTFVRHDYKSVMNVSNLSLGISHLRNSIDGLTCVDWSQYERCKDDYHFDLKIGYCNRLAIVWDGTGWDFCQDESICANIDCIARKFSDLGSECILVVHNSASIKKSLDYTWSDLSCGTQAWLLQKKLKLVDASLELKDLLKGLVDNALLELENVRKGLAVDDASLKDIVDADVLSELVDRKVVLLGKEEWWRGARDKWSSVPSEGNGGATIDRRLRLNQMEFSRAFFERRPNDVFFVKGAEVTDLEGEGFVGKCSVWNKQEVPEGMRCFALKIVGRAKGHCALLGELSEELKGFQWSGGKLHYVHLFELIEENYEHLHSINVRLSSFSVENSCLSMMDEIQVNSNEPLIIADVPGSGKSFCTKMTYSAIKKKHSTSWVDVIKLSDSANVLEEWEMNHLASSENIIQYLFKLTAAHRGSVTEEKLFSRFCQAERKCFMFFDGFDEMKSDHKPRFLLFLKALAERTKVRICVTTRRVESQELECHLGTLSYSFVPLGEREQIDYMNAQWNGWLHSLPADKRRVKIPLILEGLKSCHNSGWEDGIKTLMDELQQLGNGKFVNFEHLANKIRGMWKGLIGVDVDFWGIPLHVWMATTVAYEENFNIKDSLSIYQVYDRFVALKFDLLYNDKSPPPANMAGEGLEICHKIVVRPELQKFAKSQILRDDSHELKSETLKVILPLGLLCKEGKSVVFVHPTFGEYFFFGWLMDKGNKEKAMNVWLKVVMLSRNFCSFRQFIDGMLRYKYKTGIKQVKKRGPSLISLRENAECVQKCLYTCIRECRHGLLYHLLSISKVSLTQVIFGSATWETGNTEFDFDTSYFQSNNRQNAILFCGECLSHTLSVKKSGLHPTKVDYLRFLIELLQIAEKQGLNAKVNELVRREGLKWMGIGNYRLWADKLGKEEIESLLNLLRSLVEKDQLKKSMMRADSEMVVVNAVKCSWDAFIKFLEKIFDSDQEMMTFLQCNNFVSALINVVQIRTCDAVERIWLYIVSCHKKNKLCDTKNVLRDRENLGFYISKKNKESVSAFSSALLNRRNPDVLTFVWKIMREEMGDAECKNFLLTTNFSGMKLAMCRKCLSSYAFLKFLQELRQSCFLNDDEAINLLFPKGVKYEALFDSCCGNKSLLSLYELQVNMKNVSHNSGPWIKQLFEHYIKMVTLCFGSRSSGYDHQMLKNVIDEEFEGIRPSLESSPFVEKNSQGRLYHVSTKQIGFKLKAFLVLFWRQIQLEEKLLGAKKVVSHLEGQWVDFYGKLPCHNIRGESKVTKAYVISYIFAILANFLSKDQVSEVLLSICECGSIICGDITDNDSKAVQKLHEISEWARQMDVEDNVILLSN